jgi:hypothetical protein
VISINAKFCASHFEAAANFALKFIGHLVSEQCGKALRAPVQVAKYN